MKNSAYYARKIKRIIGGARKGPGSPQASVEQAPDRIRLLLTAILEENATGSQVRRAMSGLEEEYVDRNELRVSPIKDIVDAIGRDYPQAWAKAEKIVRALNVAFDRTNALSLDYLQKKPKRDIRRLLSEDLGLSRYAEAVVTLYGFGGHAVAVDGLLVAALKLDGYVDPDTDGEDVQGFLERIVPAKDDLGCHEALREYVAKSYRRAWTELTRQEKIRQAEEAAAQAKARAEAEAAVAAEEARKQEAADAAREAAKAAKAKTASKAPAKRAGVPKREPSRLGSPHK